MLAVCAGVACASPAESGGASPPVIENYQKYIGRDLVTEDRAVNAKIHRPLPLSCPPFHLRDKNGEIIDPTKNPDGSPADPMLPVQQQGIPRAVSTKQTCSPCHDYNTITRGYHFQMGRDELYGETPPSEGTSPNRGPGFFGKWLPLYQRELAPKHYEDADNIDMTPFEWVVSCGVCHPGGGPAEYDRAGNRYDKTLRLDRGGATMFGDSDYLDSPWDRTGVIEADCFICHLESYEYSIRAQQIKKHNFEFAATGAAGLGYIWGSVIDGQQPKVYYDKSLFRADGTVFLHIRRPNDRQCMACHDLSSTQKRGSSWHSHYMQDVHTQQGVKCTDCHPNDIRHNIAKGSSSSQTVRDDLDNTALSCKECHETQENGAPDARHKWLPALHLERISCEACHITRRPFTATGVVDTITGKAVQLSAQTDPTAYDSYLFGAMWGTVTGFEKENLIDPFTPAQLEAAAAWLVVTDAPVRKYFAKGDGSSYLPSDPVTVREFVEQQGGMTSEFARALVILALQETAGIPEGSYAVGVFRGEAFKVEGGQVRILPSKLQPRRPGATIAESPYDYGRSKGDGMIHPEGAQVGAFWAFMDGETLRPVFLKDMQAAWNLLTSDEYKFYRYPGQPRSGSAPALPPAPEKPVPPAGQGVSSENERPENMILAQAPAESNTAPIEPAPAAPVESVPTPVEPAPAPVEPAPAVAPAETAPAPAEQAAAPAASPEEDAKAAARKAAEAKRAEEAALVQALSWKLEAYAPTERSLLEVFDDNNDTFPEANTDEEIGLIAWALQQAVPRLAGRDLFYVKGASVCRVHVDGGGNPYNAELLDMDRIGENEPFISAERREQFDEPGAFSWDKPVQVWKTVETRLAAPFKATVEPIDPASNAQFAALAQRLPWTASHGVEPVAKALGANGCTDCHAEDSHFFFGKAVMDPFQSDATPRTAPMWAVLGYNPDAIKLGVWREGVLKRYSPWIVLAVLAMILLHFVFIGSKPGSPPGRPNVLRLRFHERISHLVAMTTVVFLAVTGFCFLLGAHDPLSHWARTWHTYVGYVACGGVAAIFLCWVFFMFPAKGDFKWMLVAGGYLGGVKGHVPAGKFNAGQKALFWIAIAAMTACGVTGVLMGLNRGSHFDNQELIYTIHDAAALLMILVLMAHVYLAGVVVPHSLRAIFGGKVSDIWAREHHSLWQFTVKEDAHHD
jgi:formate dehydrogenase gamma subunit